MTTNRKELLSKLYSTTTTEEERVLLSLALERICADMCDFYIRFYAHSGPGAMVYIPDAKESADSMFYLSVPQLINAQDDLRNKELDGPHEVIQKTIAIAESLNPEKEALFLIQDQTKMALIRYNRERPISDCIVK